MNYPVCPCDGAAISTPVNLPQLAHIRYRVGTYADFRRAMLTPLFVPADPQPVPVEHSLAVNGVPVWRAQQADDLGVMVAEWFAYVADIITFYNEQIANQAYLRTANLPESVTHLIALLGYRPRPAIGATGVLAALVSPGPTFGGRSIVLPQGLQFQSKPTPGQAPQTFELRADTTISAIDQLPAAPPPHLLTHITQRIVLPPGLGHPYQQLRFLDYYLVLLRGAIKTIDAGAVLVLRSRNPAADGGPWLANVSASAIQPSPSGVGQQTQLKLTLSAAPPTTLAAAGASLERANQSCGVWEFFGGAVGTSTIHLGSLTRQIRPGQWILLSNGSGSPAAVLVQVLSIADVIWDATGSAGAPDTPSDSQHPVPIPHSQLTLQSTLNSNWQSASAVTVSFDWISVGTLIDQPYSSWSGAPTSLVGTGAQPFPSWSGQPLLLQDTTALGIEVVGGSAGDFNLIVADLPDPVPQLTPPFLALPNLLPVTCGKTVTNETLGSGDATNPAQDFTLSKAPVTYLQQGASYASTIALTVDAIPWKEVPSFFGQAPDAAVFVSREDDAGKTHVIFGDGVNGARLPTGTNNVVATYRVGAGAQSPPAGKLVVIAKSYPGLRTVLNPVAVGGGADPDPPDQIRRFAPRSVLTFGRAVSVFDYEALAAQTPGVTRARAVWAWDDTRQRSLVTVYVGDDAAARDAARTALDAAGDPNRPILVQQATEVPVSLVLTLVVTPGMDSELIAAAVATALTDTEVGLFGSWNLGVGQPVFDSQIEAAVLSVKGAIAVTAMTMFAASVLDAGPLHSPAEGAFYSLDPAAITLTQEPDPNG